MQVKWGDTASEDAGSKDILKYWGERLESEGFVAKATGSYPEREENQNLSHLKALKIRPDREVTVDGIS
jgi:hypothetical protein